MVSSRNLWIGLNDIEKEGEYRWHDGSLVTWTSWMANQPNNLHGNQQCVNIEDRVINDIDCNLEINFICEVLQGKYWMKLHQINNNSSSSVHQTEKHGPDANLIDNLVKHISKDIVSKSD